MRAARGAHDSTSKRTPVEVVGRAGTPEHDAIEPVVILERPAHSQPEPGRVEPNNVVEVVRRAGNAQDDVVIRGRQQAHLHLVASGELRMVHVKAACCVIADDSAV